MAQGVPDRIMEGIKIGAYLPDIGGQKPLSGKGKTTTFSGSATKAVLKRACYITGIVSIKNTAGSAGECTLYNGDPSDGGTEIAYQSVAANSIAHIPLGGAVVVAELGLWITFTQAGKVTVIINND